MASTHGVNDLSRLLLDRLRLASERHTNLGDAPAYSEALRVAEAVLCQAGDPADLTASDCADKLRGAAIGLAATRVSFASNRDPLDRRRADSEPVSQHMNEVAQCLVRMADSISPQPEVDPLRADPGAAGVQAVEQQASSGARVIDLATRRS
jgi:hypothetical protein